MGSDETLLTSAKQFLVEALRNHRDGRRSFAILHAVTAAELVLKERLAQIHPSLIYSNIDARSFRGEQTVSLNKLAQRLSNLGVQVDPKEAGLIRTFAEWRNQIVHHMPSFDEKAADRQLPQLLDFLAVFLRRELGTPLEGFLPKSLYRTASALLREWKRVVQNASRQAEAEGSVLSESCPDCGTAGVLCLRDEKRVFCHLCAAQQYSYDRCTQCGRQTVSGFLSLDAGNYCDRCVDEAGDQYTQMSIDIERGK
jgi:HEPN domain-containing protein